MQTVVVVGVYLNESDHAYAAALAETIREAAEKDDIKAIVEVRIVKVPERD